MDYAAAAKSFQLCPTLWDPLDGSPPGSSVPGILQARTLEWVAISFSIAWKRRVKVKSLSRVQLLATSWTAAHQAPPPMGFSKQEHWSGSPLPSPLTMLASVKTLFYTSKSCHMRQKQSHGNRQKPGNRSNQFYPSGRKMAPSNSIGLKHSFILFTYINPVCACVCVCVRAHYYAKP